MVGLRLIYEVDSYFSGEELLRRRYVDVPGAHYAIGARNRARPEGKGGDSLRAAHLENLAETQDICPRLSLRAILGYG